jgi:predicted KAP-like P-loop ATPase
MNTEENNTQLPQSSVSDSFSDENDFAPWQSQEEKDFEYSIMSEYFEEERKEAERTQIITNRILNALKNIKPCQWFEDLNDYAKESETHNPFKIVKKPKGNWQEEGDYESLGGVWVEQMGGYPIEDSFYGTVTVKIDEKRYLEMPFSC